MESAQLLCWGENGNGQSTVPAGHSRWQVDSEPDIFECALNALMWQVVAAGGVHSCGIVQSNAAVICWGSNSDGQITVPAAFASGAKVHLNNAACHIHSSLLSHLFNPRFGDGRQWLWEALILAQSKSSPIIWLAGAVTPMDK